MTDLEVAADNVGAYDTLDVNKDYALSSTYRFSEGNTPSWGRFYSQRGSRLNYYAIRMLQARVALYDGDYEKAKDVSGKLVQLVTGKEFSMESAYSIANNPKIMKEVLFAFYNENLIDNTQDWFDYTNTQVLKVEDPALFTAISSDKRSGLVKNATLTVFNADKNGSVENYIPAIRMSEAYYILAESMAKTGDLKGAIKTFNVFAKQRGMTSASSRIPENAEMDVFTDFLIKDARKEFAGLGQNVFMYKRLNIPVQYSKGNVPESFEVLVLPVPSTENAI